MSASNFFKHLSCYCYQTLSRHFLRPRSFPSSAPRSSFAIAPSLPPSSASFSSSTESSVAPYLSVLIHCPKHVVDPFSEALLCFGASSVSVDEADDDAASGSSVASDEAKSMMRIDSIFPVHEEVRTCISQAANSIGLKEIPDYKVEKREDRDWITKTQETFEPVEVTEGLWIVPEWKTPPVVEGINIILNPGLAFGTGEHPTTKLCLLLLQRSIKGGETFLDYGTGSGILAIAALKFGAASSVGLDIDPLAITSAHCNAALNNIQLEKLRLHLVPSETEPPSVDEDTRGLENEHCSSGSKIPLAGEKFDVVIANILLNPLMELADHIVSFAKPGAATGISGILSEQLPGIIERYSQFLEGISVSEMDGWACVSGIKKAKLTDS